MTAEASRDGLGFGRSYGGRFISWVMRWWSEQRGVGAERDRERRWNESVPPV